MHFETLKSRKKKYFLYALVVSVALLLPLVLTFSRAKYKMTESIPLVQGKISYSSADLNLVAIKIQNENGKYESSDTIPESGYDINNTESYCTIPDGNGGTINDESIMIEYNNGKVNFLGISKTNTKCYIFFDIYMPIASERILANKTINVRTDFSTILTTDTTGTIYTAEDDYGTSYYFAGAPTDNWVKFAGFYWRIIRINGDGTIRMIYQGESANATGTGTQIGTAKFNEQVAGNEYVGYMYTSWQVHGTGTASTIKVVLDTWYTNNLSEYENYIATGEGATFCNDRTPYSGSGTGTAHTLYNAINRLVDNKNASFKCANSGDKFITSIGLVTADELSYAGGLWETLNTDYYLYTEQNYWTMSPFNTSQYGIATMFIECSTNSLEWSSVGGTNGVRPVINLKADTIFPNGTGTAENPYVVQ